MYADRAFSDYTELTYRAFTRTGLNADDTIKSIVDRLGIKPSFIKKKIVYVPIKFADLVEADTSTLFVTEFKEKKCYVIREWKVTFDGIIVDLPIEKGLISYEIKSLLTNCGEGEYV